MKKHFETGKNKQKQKQDLHCSVVSILFCHQIVLENRKKNLSQYNVKFLFFHTLDEGNLGTTSVSNRSLFPYIYFISF